MLFSLLQVVYNSNEGARKMERTEEMYYIQKTLVFKTKVNVFLLQLTCSCFVKVFSVVIDM